MKNLITSKEMSRKIFNPIFYLIIITALTVFLINTGSLNSIDTLNRLQVTRSLWTDAPQVLETDKNGDSSSSSTVGFSAVGRNGKRYVTWGIGQSLVMLPADIFAYNLIKLLSLEGRNPAKLEAGIVSYLTFPLINILSIIASFQLLKKLDFNTKQATYGALSLLFCTSFLHYSQIHQENSLDFLMTTSAYLFHLLWLESNSILYLFLGLLPLGFNLLVRLTLAIGNISLGLFTGILIYLRSKVTINDLNSTKKIVIQYLTAAALIYMFFLGIDRFYHWIRFDTFSGSYTTIWAAQMKSLNPNLPKLFPFSTPFQEGFLGFLFSPERSLFLFNPLTIVTLYLSIKNWKNISYNLRAFLISLVFLLFANIVVHSTWFLWGGAGSWGPRYVTNASQLIGFVAIPLAIKFTLTNVIEKFIFKILVIVSFFIQISSVIFDFNLELVQSSIFVIGQRFINILATVTGNFDDWGLRPTNIPISESQKFILVAFFPWKNATSILPAHLASALQIAWIIVLLILVYLVFFLVRNTKLNKIDSEA